MSLLLESNLPIIFLKILEYLTADKNIEDEDMEDEDVGSDEDEIDEELMLPDVLANISSNEKKELLKFKRSHNEVRPEYIPYATI